MTLRRILFADDLSERAQRAGRRAVQLSGQTGADLEVVHVVEEAFPEPGAWGLPADVPNPAAQVREATEGRLRERSPDGVGAHRVVFGDSVGTLVRTADNEGFDVTVIGAHGQRFVRDWLVGTTAEQLVRHSLTPTLVVRQEPRGPYQRILVATDFSACADVALRRAAEWFGTEPLRLLHVLDTSPLERMRGAGVDERLVERHYEELVARSARDLDAAVTRAGLEAGSVTVDQRSGYPASVLQQLAEAEGVDLVVLGNHGRGRWGGLLLGSVAGRLLHALESDVLLVRSDD